MTDPVLWQQEGHVLRLVMNRPETRNALGSVEELDHFVSLLRRAQADRALRAVVLTGAGQAFAAGGNVKDMREKNGLFGGSPREMRDTYRRTVQTLAQALRNLEVPVIAAVNGPAIGQGCGLACLADIRIAAASAKFAVSFLKLGLVPGDGGAYILPRLIGQARAAQMFFTGEVIDAPTARDWGLVAKVVADDVLLDEAMAMARAIAAQPPDVLRLTKRLLREGERAPYETVLELSAAFQAMAQHTEDHREAIDAFFEKRPGEFAGR
ncbi:crotonase/enoyl-CoA hydratase family protein [Zavarzinia aquatilis]|uniref:Enoyl-CoA hydratase n=1 Tax=Zavarzinia aquatilis TaxID=2211142 RepID=A0A317E8S1_9PROT|nr:crotonase/enoyl-CoA hydratase family protein [Zavarzinia aquatilis]PWR22600.1 enoyl-CoA hydratase [Zavarzinia aquatilis]